MELDGHMLDTLLLNLQVFAPALNATAADIINVFVQHIKVGLIS
jgi:hypothetical protein